MSVVEAIILGIIQGLTEFLPVSSSGHLELAQVLFGNQNNAEGNLMFTIVVHGATALATLVVFRADVWSIVRGLFQFTNNESAQFSLRIVLSMIPGFLALYRYRLFQLSKICPCSLKIIDLPLKNTNAFSFAPSSKNLIACFFLNA